MTLKQRLLKVQEICAKFNIDKEKAQNDIEYYASKRPDYLRIIDEYIEQFEKLKEKVNLEIEKCNNCGPRIQVSVPLADVEKEIRMKKAQLREIEKETGSRESVYKNYIDSREAYVGAKKSLEKIAKLNLDLSNALQIRVKSWEEFRAAISYRSKMLFSALVFIFYY